MGQSDTESTCSSVRVNPGSPRDLSVLLDEADGPLPLVLGHEAAGSPSSSSGDSGELDSSVIITGEVPKRGGRGGGDIPVIDLTSPDHDEQPAQQATARQGQYDEQLSVDVREFAERIEQRLEVMRQRVASIRRARLQNHDNRLSRLERVRRSFPYSRRERARGRDRTENHVSASVPAPSFQGVEETSAPAAHASQGNLVPPVTIPEEDTPIVIDVEENEPSTTASSSVQADSRFSSEIGETPLDEVYLRLQQARERTQNSIERARRLAQEARRTIEMVGRNLPNCLRSDEVMARQLQARYDHESALGARQHARSGQDASTFLSRAAAPHVAAGPMPSPLHYRRRRHLRPHHFAGPDTVPDLLLPFVSVVSLPPPPPLHHFGDPSADNEDYEALWNLSERLGPAKSRGLSKEAIDRIPSFRYSASSKDLSNGSCVVCMMEYSNREKLRRLNCDHDFHSKCIDRWLKNNRTCPVCRKDVNSQK